MTSEELIINKEQSNQKTVKLYERFFQARLSMKKQKKTRKKYIDPHTIKIEEKNVFIISSLINLKRRNHLVVLGKHAFG
jgi:hypothetical protein